MRLLRGETKAQQQTVSNAVDLTVDVDPVTPTWNLPAVGHFGMVHDDQPFTSVSIDDDALPGTVRLFRVIGGTGNEYNDIHGAPGSVGAQWSLAVQGVGRGPVFCAPGSES